MGGMPGSVMMFYELNTDKVNCDALFNLICPYANPIKIKFVTSKPGMAMVQVNVTLAQPLLHKHPHSRTRAHVRTLALSSTRSRPHSYTCSLPLTCHSRPLARSHSLATHVQSLTSDHLPLTSTRSLPITCHSRPVAHFRSLATLFPCLSQVDDPQAASSCLSFLKDLEIFGKKIECAPSKHAFIADSRAQTAQPDGTPSQVDYTASRNHRFRTGAFCVPRWPDHYDPLIHHSVPALCL
jgi:hypothetical protein